MNGGARGKFVGRADELALLDESLTLLTARPHTLERLGESWARLLADTERVCWIRLAGLAPPQVQALAAASGWELTAESGARLQEHTAGNPLYVLALLGTFPRDAGPPRPACWQPGEAA